MLVFWFSTIIGKVVFFITVKLRNLISIILLLFFGGVNGIIANNQGFFSSLVYFC